MGTRGRDRWSPLQDADDEADREAATDEALAALDADTLRAILRAHLPNLEDRARRILECELVEAGARRGARPSHSPSPARVEEIIGDVEVGGFIEAEIFDGWLTEANAAALRGEDEVARRLFRALLQPLGRGDVDLGQHEVVEEVLGTDLTTCAARYVNSVYRLTAPEERVEAVLSAFEDVEGILVSWNPLRRMEEAAAAPLPDFEAFVIAWRDHLRAAAAQDPAPRVEPWDSTEASRLREAVERAGGDDALAEHARATRRVSDLRTWCERTREAGDWTATLAAYDEAAALVEGARRHAADFLDGAALCAQELGRPDLAARLEAAWRAEPTLVRLRRWLTTAASKSALCARAREALAAVPGPRAKQRALLHLLVDENTEAAALVAAAPALGWSNPEHPGHLAFPVLARRFTATPPDASEHEGESPWEDMTFEDFDPYDLDSLLGRRSDPVLAAEKAETLIERAQPRRPLSSAEREAVVAYLRTAAEKRVHGVTEERRTRHYGHAASLVAACVTCDPEGETAAWCRALRERTKRFRKLRAELGAVLGPE